MHPNFRLVLLFSLASCLLGGEVYGVRCGNPSCGFRSDFRFGGAKGFDQVQGFCSGCENFVAISWPRNDPRTKPTPIKYVGSIHLEADRSIYDCPDCRGSFQNICKPSALKTVICPKCKESRLSYALKKHR